MGELKIMENKLIYICEDDDALRELVAYAVKSEGYTLKAFDAAEKLLEECSRCVPDLMVLDIMLPGIDGVEALKRFRQTYAGADTRVIMLTAKGTEGNRVAGLDAGADDYVTKPFSVLELMARIRAHLRKKTVAVSGGVLNCGDISLFQDAREVKVDKKNVVLTQKEFELLRLLMLNTGVALEREKIVKEIWGYDYFGESRTVDIHIKNIREKLGGAGKMIQSMRGVGYMMVRM
jgi:two-component system alkaline phosphatase synthesis response regulator PhoP